MDPVVSITMATLYCPGAAPCEAAEETEVSEIVLAELTPNTASARMKYVGMTTVCLTCKALAPTGPEQDTPMADTAGAQLNVVEMVGLGKLELALTPLEREL